MFDEDPHSVTKKWSWSIAFYGLLFISSFIAIGSGLYFLVSFSNTSCLQLDQQPPVASKSAVLSSSDGHQIYVDVAGAIEKPGLYQLAKRSRLADAIKAAGGFLKEADDEYVAKELNLAQQLSDGDKIYIFSQAEREYEQTAAEFCQNLAMAGGGDSSDASGLISINSSSQKELETLAGIGEKRAAEIIDSRPYLSLSELVAREVLTANIYQNIKGLLKL